KRNQDFEKLSRDIVSTVDDAAVENYLHKFVDGNVNASPSTFDATLYLSLYSVAHQRFPHNLNVVNGLLKYYSAHQLWSQWRSLVAEYYFTSADVRTQLISHLASKRELRSYLDKARTACSQNVADNNTLLPYKLFRADAAAWLSNYEEAVDAYREMN